MIFVNVAVTDFAASTVTVHGSVPVQLASDQPSKVEPAFDVAVSVTSVPVSNSAEQVDPQSIPAGELETEPEPVPARTTSSGVTCVNVAVTDVAAFIVTVHVPVPVQAPDHPAKIEVALGVAVSVTCEPTAKGAEQVAPQSIPAGELVTVPEPVPARTTPSG